MTAISVSLLKLAIIGSGNTLPTGRNNLLCGSDGRNAIVPGPANG